MSNSRLLLWFLSVSAVIILAVMNLGTVPEIRDAAGGMQIFDNRPAGYNFDTAHEFLTELYKGDRSGLDLYLGVQRRLDTLFPLVLMVAMPWALWVVSEGWPRPYRHFGVICGILGPFCDLVENYFVAIMLRAGPDGVKPWMVEVASDFSTAKWVLDLLAVCTFILMSFCILLGLRRPA